ncbi:hypothetical protein ISCGN_004037 [Ixodes scapularis]
MNQVLSEVGKSPSKATCVPLENGWTEPGSTEYRQILSGPDYQVFENGTLRIAQVRVADRGSYLCQASNGVGTGLSTVITLKVHVPARFTESYRNQTVRRGHAASLECRALGDAPISISWSRNGRRLDTHKSSHFKVMESATSDGHLSTMSVSEAQRDHSGIFTCEVINDYGQDETQIRLLVQEPPEPPTRFNVSSVNSRSVSLTWAEPYSGNSPVISYLIQFKNVSASWSSGESSVHNVTAGRDQTSWTVRGLQPAGTYHFRAAAANALGLGPFTQPPLLVVTDEEVPGSPPTEVSVQTLGPQSIKVTWKPPLPELRHGHIKGYYVGYKLHNSSELHLYKTVEARDADPEAPGECVLNNLRKHTKYSVLVQAYNAIGAGPRSDEAVVRTAQDVPQVAPPGVQCSSSSPTTIRVSWTKLLEKNLDGVHKGYRVIYRQIRTQHAQYEGFTGEEENSWAERDVNAGSSAAVLSSLEPYSNYSVRVAARTGAGAGAFSDPVHCSTPEAVPQAPEDIKALILAPDAILVSWKPPVRSRGVLLRYTVYSRSHGYREQIQTHIKKKPMIAAQPPLPELRHGHIKGYYVGYKLHNSSELHLYKTVEARDADPEAPGECVLNNLRKHTKYSVLVQAYNAIGAGPRSDEAVVRTAQDVPQVAPPGVQCSSSSPTTIRVSWTKLLEKNLDGVHKGYRVIYRQIRTQHAQYEGFTGEEENSWAERDVNAGSSAAVLSSLEPYSNYSVRVAARTGAGAGAFSDPVHCSTPEAVPQAPEDIKALILAPDAILVSWKPPVRSRGVLLRYTVYSRSHGYREQAAAAIGPGSAAPPAADVGPVRHVAVPSSQFWHETRGLRTGQRYEFWVTASTAAGEGPATRIVTQSPEIRAPARIASFNRDVSVALKQDLELPCRTVGQPMPIREWRTG